MYACMCGKCVCACAYEGRKDDQGLLETSHITVVFGVLLWNAVSK